MSQNLMRFPLRYPGATDRWALESASYARFLSPSVRLLYRLPNAERMSFRGDKQKIIVLHPPQKLHQGGALELLMSLPLENLACLPNCLSDHLLAWWPPRESSTLSFVEQGVEELLLPCAVAGRDAIFGGRSSTVDLPHSPDMEKWLFVVTV